MSDYKYRRFPKVKAQGFSCNRLPVYAFVNFNLNVSVLDVYCTVNRLLQMFCVLHYNNGTCRSREIEWEMLRSSSISLARKGLVTWHFYRHRLCLLARKLCILNVAVCLGIVIFVRVWVVSVINVTCGRDSFNCDEQLEAFVFVQESSQGLQLPRIFFGRNDYCDVLAYD